MFFSPLDGDVSTLYLRPKTKWCYSTEFWYENRPVGHNTLSLTYKRICKLAGVEGQYSNHSGRATAATRLLKAGVPDKMALARTGHRTLESLREYQSLNETDNKQASDALSSCCDSEISLKEKCSVEILCQSDDVSDEVLSQALECYESSTTKSNVGCNSLNLDGMFVNASIGTVNVFLNNNNGLN